MFNFLASIGFAHLFFDFMGHVFLFKRLLGMRKAKKVETVAPAPQLKVVFEEKPAFPKSFSAYRIHGK